MTVPTNGASGTPDSSAGGDNQEKNDTVAYETYRKVLSEKKKAAEELLATQKRLADIETQQKEKEDSELKAKQQYKELYELKEKELSDTKDKLKLKEEQELNAKKVRSFFNTLSAKVDEKYWVHIDIDAIKVNPDSGEIDQLSVAKAVDDFKKQYPELISRPNDKGMPNASPKGDSGGLTYEEWRKLPTAEMKKRKKEIIDTTTN